MCHAEYNAVIASLPADVLPRGLGKRSAPKTKRVYIHFPEEILTRLQAIASARGVHTTELVRGLVRRAVEDVE